jgi:pilus assembly protein CpaE
VLALGVGATAPVLALAPRESVAALRAAVRAGASGFFVWPAERDELLDRIAGASRGRGMPDRRATIVAVHGSRGGAGCTFVATHLAQAFERSGASCALVELDLTYGDLTHALGAGEDARTLADLQPVETELSWEHVQGVLEHGALLAPPVDAIDQVSDRLVRRVVQVVAASTDVVVLHLPRVIDDRSRWAVGQADRVLEVLRLDVLSFRAARRSLDAAPIEPGEKVAFVVNGSSKSEITVEDVRRVFGRDPIAVIGHDAGAPRAQDHGRLLAPKGRTGRAFARLATALLEPTEAARRSA